jgi:hypothetical protein
MAEGQSQDKRDGRQSRQDSKQQHKGSGHGNIESQIAETWAPRKE